MPNPGEKGPASARMRIAVRVGDWKLLRFSGAQPALRQRIDVRRGDLPTIAADGGQGYAGKPNPAWKSLEADRREDWARRMAIYAAMVKHVDDGSGRSVKRLKDNGTSDNTLIVLLSDNGACYEYGLAERDGLT